MITEEDLESATFIVSSKGKKIINIKDFEYRLKKRKEDKEYWYCMNNDCMAKLHVHPGSDTALEPRIINVIGGHDHPASNGKLRARFIVNQ